MVYVIAHRGLRNEFPENSLEAIDAALKLPRIHGVEFDVELTGDDHPVVLHQETLVPSSDRCSIQLAARDFVSRDWVMEADAETILKMDGGSWMGPSFSHVKVPALWDVLNLAWGAVVAYVELKDATYWGQRDQSRPRRIVEAVLPYLSSFHGAVNVISFNPEILKIISEESPRVPTTLALWTEWQSRMDEALREASRCGATTVSLADSMVLEEPEWVEVVHGHGLKIHVYPVSPARGEPEFLEWIAASQHDKWQELSTLGVDAVLSDFARESLAVL